MYNKQTPRKRHEQRQRAETIKKNRRTMHRVKRACCYRTTQQGYDHRSERKETGEGRVRRGWEGKERRGGKEWDRGRKEAIEGTGEKGGVRKGREGEEKENEGKEKEKEGEGKGNRKGSRRTEAWGERRGEGKRKEIGKEGVLLA